MKLNKVELYGFKSFPQRTEILFHEGITGIVGPNGSGKSNIADAVRWVLGEQSARALRGAKMEDVIFGGTEKRKPMNYCEVSLVFDNEDQKLNSLYAQVAVTRRVYRDGEGEYFLNQKPCRLKDIHELFRDTGIGRDGYSLIGQGRIDEILSPKGEERRMAFEEAAGIMTFRVRKEEAERKLEKTREHLARVSDILTEIEQRLEPLEKQAAAAREYMTLAERLKTLEIDRFFVRHEKLSEKIAALAQGNAALREALAQQEVALQAIGEGRRQLEEELAQADTSLQSARQEQTRMRQASFAAQAAAEQQRAAWQQTQQQAQLHAEAQEQLAARQTELEAISSRGMSDEDAAKAALAAAQQQAQRQQEDVARLEQSALEAEEALNTHKEALLAAVNRLGDMKSAQARQEAMIAQLDKQVVSLLASKQQLQQEKERLQGAADAAGQTLQDTEQRLQTLTEDLQQAQQTRASCEDALRAYAEKAQRLQSELSGAQNRHAVLSDMARDYEGYHQAVKMALSYAKDDAQVFGAVAKLIQVPRQLEEAIDMFLGGTLQHIVTADEMAAKRMIDYLRSNRLGRTTFLPLSAIKPRTLTAQERQVLKLPGCIGVASELIGYEARFQAVIENILGRTVVAQDLDAAIQIARAGKQAFNVVTLEGDVMRAGGAMTGGTSQARTTSLLGRERELKDLQGVIRQLRTQLEQGGREEADLASSLRQAQAGHAQAEHLVQEERIAVARDTEKKANALHEAQGAAIALAQTEEAISQAQAAMEELRADLVQSRQQGSAADLDMGEMEGRTRALQQTLFAARERLNVQREAAAAQTAHLAQLTHQSDMLLRDRSRWLAERQSLERQQVRAAEKQQQLAQALEEAAAGLAQSEAQAQEKEALLAAADSHLAQLESLRHRLSQKMRENAETADTSHEGFSRDQEKLHRNEMASTRLESELQTLCDYIWNTHQLTIETAQPLRQQTELDVLAAEKEIAVLKERIRELGMVNVNAIEEYASTQARFGELSVQRDDALKAEEDLSALIKRLLGNMEKQFVQEFEKLSQYFSQTFTRLFGGGHAQLRLSDPNAPLTCDIEIAAQPPGKKLQLLSLLSGGERALTAIAILFAMLKLKATPFCILDEIEAALDDANIAYFADYLCEYARTTQFIVITHRKTTMERCDALYGVSMAEKGISNMLSVNLQDYAV